MLKFDNRNIKLMLSISFAIALYVARVKIAHSTYFGFLVWNLFLAAIPYFVSQWMLARSETGALPKIVFWLSFSSWLLFLPNSPYIITDLVHLHDRHSNLLWLDMFLVFVFALNGLLLGLLSLLDIRCLLASRFSSKITALIVFLVCILSGYGIYLGRFLRFNSWDLLTKPVTLFSKIFYSLNEPKVYLITLAFGGFFWILYQLLTATLPGVEKKVLG